MNKKADLIKIFTITDLNNSEPIGEAVLVENFN